MKIKTKAACWQAVLESLNELLAEMGEEPGEITADTRLNRDLGISSTDAIHRMILLEDRLREPLSFEKLAVRDGEYVQDLKVGELFDFVCVSTGITGGAVPGTT